MTEDESHLIVEGDEATDLARFLTEEFSGPKVDTVDIWIDGTTGADGYAGTSKIGDYLHESRTINDAVNVPRAITSTFGMQVFRPHYVSQWPTIGLGFDDENILMEDNFVESNGVIIQENGHGLWREDSSTYSHNLGPDPFDTYTNQYWNVLPQYRYNTIEFTPEKLDVTKTQFVKLEDASGIILLEDGGRVQNEDVALKSVMSFSGDAWAKTAKTGPAVRIQLEDEDTGNNLLLEDGNELLTEDSTGANAFSRNKYEVSNEQLGNGLLLSGLTTIGDYRDHPMGIYAGSAIYDMYVGSGAVVRSSSMTPSKLSGSVAIAHNGTTATGTGTLFSTELSVGDEFQTSDENVLLEESLAADELLFEDDERIVHETDSFHYFWYIAEIVETVSFVYDSFIIFK
jgi:hypothetical protein